MIQDSWADLHIHTIYSDGLLTPAQIILKANQKELSAIGIVDHDTVDGIPEAISTGNSIGVEVVPGVELSCQYEGRDIHIIGYYIDTEYPQLKEYLELFIEERYKRAVKMVRNLNRMGVQVTMDEVIDKAKGKSIGRPHLAEVLMEKGYVETFQEAFRQYIGYNSKAYERKYKLFPEEAIRLISEAKGLSFLAHPGFAINDEIIFKLIKEGLDGIEVVHPKLNAERTQYLQRIAKSNHILICGGSDCHGGRDGYLSVGNFNIPYAVLEEIKGALQKRRSIDSADL